MLVGGEAFRWWPWVKDGGRAGMGDGGDGGNGGKMEGKLLNAKGQWEVSEEGWGVLELVHPKPGMHTYIPCTSRHANGVNQIY